MAMFMYACRVFISLLLFLVHCEVTVEQDTQGPLDEICTTTWFDETLTSIPPLLAEEDEDVINTLLGCSRNEKPSPSCFINSNAVTCDCYLENHKRCRVVIIDFSNRRLEGTIPENIGDLQYLKRLYLNGNKLHGSIPKSFPKLTNLLDLSLCDNSLEGPIPSFFGQMTSLRNIYLCKNFFDQKIPAELSSLPYLEYLDLSYNFLSDKIPNELGNIESLIGLYLSDNQLSGVIPSQLGNLVNLKKLNLKNNEFIGPLPSSFKSLTKLTYLNVRGNNLNETKLDIFEQWQDLRYMNLMGNNISSPFHGQFPKLKSLMILYISDLVGKSSSFPDISEMESLRVLTLRNCKIADPIPDWIWNLSGLRYLDLSFNSLVGPIPEAVGNSLKYIFLRRNNLTGTIPAWMTASRYIRKNNSEKIPVWINVSPYVDVSDNDFINVNISDREKLNSNMVAKWDQVDFHCKSGTQIYDRLYINCGGESVSVNGSDYEADLHPHGESTFFKSYRSNWGYSSMGKFSSARRDKYILNESCQGDAQLYATARLSPISLKYYGFCLKTGNYEVKLHFSEISSSKNSSHSKAGRLFDVDIQGENKLRNFNIEKHAGSLNKAITMVYPAYVNNGRLEIHLYWSGKGSTLYPSEYYGPLISAITVTPDQSELSSGVLAGISGFALLLLILFIGFSWRFQDKLRREGNTTLLYILFGFCWDFEVKPLLRGCFRVPKVLYIHSRSRNFKMLSLVFTHPLPSWKKETRK